MFDLPRETHSWIIEEISGGKHFRQMIYSRFVKYLSVLKKNKRLSLRTIFNIVSGDVRTSAGSNVRKILLDTGLDPRSVSSHQLSGWRVHQPADNWSVPLLASLLELRNKNCEVNFDIEDEAQALNDQEIDFMIEAVCMG